MDVTESEEKMNIMTAEGLAKLQEELEYRKGTEREAIKNKIKEARDMGDLSENAEYTAAREKQSENEGRINELVEILKHVQVVDESEINTDVVNIGSYVRLLDVELDEEMEYKLVGSIEADSLSGKISNESPVGKAIFHAKVGDTVTVETEAGEFPYKILGISLEPTQKDA